MPTIVHFEIPADDIPRTISFYSSLFGWEIKEVPEMNYWLISTGGEGVGGGIMKRQSPQQPIVNYIDVPSVDLYAAQVKKLGGKIIVSKMAVPGMGYFALCVDTENNMFGIWESDKDAK